MFLSLLFIIFRVSRGQREQEVSWQASVAFLGTCPKLTNVEKDGQTSGCGFTIISPPLTNLTRHGPWLTRME